MKRITIKHNSRYLGFAALVATMVITFGFSTVRGGLLFSDSFEYPVGPLAGQGPPAGAPPGQTGWSLVSGIPQVLSQGLHFSRVLSAGEGAGFRHEPVDNTVAANLTPVHSGVVWIGFLFQQVGGPTPVFGFAVLNLSAEDGQPPTGYGVLFVSNRFGIDNDTGDKG